MISLIITRLTSSTSNSPLISTFRPKPPFHIPKSLNQPQPRIRNGVCRAELSQDAPFAVAIGASILNSLVFPVPSGPNDDEESDSVMDSADARFAVMGIISFIPYFNWLSWVFAWMDTGKKRYLVYALVYLAPYLRSNLSLSPEDSWLPIASILFCIIHIQLEASIKNGDLQGLQLFSDSAKDLRGKKGIIKFSEERRKDLNNLPSAQEQSRNEVRDWGVPRKPSRDPEENLNEDEADDGRKH